jgi:hypothetical membrane protein
VATVAQDIELFVGLAGIAGVFVGFAALISFTRRPEIAPFQLAQIRGVVTIGLLVIVASLVPVGLNRYGITGHTLWVTSSALFLALVWVVMVMGMRRSENRRLMASQAKATPLLTAFFWTVLEIPIHVPLVLVLIGVFPDLEPAFYTTALVVHLFEAAWVLAQLVYSQASATEAGG